MLILQQLTVLSKWIFIVQMQNEHMDISNIYAFDMYMVR